MRRTWTWLLAAALLAVLAGLAWWWVGRSAWRPPTPIRPALPDIALVQDGAAVQVKAALDSPLLWSSRAPVETPEAAPEKAPESELAQLRLMAVLETAGQRVALLQRPDRTVLKLNSSDPESGWRLVSFDGAVAQFVSRSGQRVERPLERVGAAVPAPAPGGAQRGAPSTALPPPQPRAGQSANLDAQQGAANRSGGPERPPPGSSNGLPVPRSGASPMGMGSPPAVSSAPPAPAGADANAPAGR